MTTPVRLSAYWETAAGVPAVGLANVPTIRIRRLDTDALVITDVAMTEVGDGQYKFQFTPPVDGIEYVARADGDPTAVAQVPASIRFQTGQLTDTENLVQYDGAVWYDSVNGEAGTAYPVGTRARPSNDEASTRTIADAAGIKKIMLADTFVLDQTYDGFTFEASQGGGSVSGNSQDAANSIFNAVGITGDFTSTADMFGTAMAFFGAVTGWRGTAVRPGMAGTIDVAPGQILTIAQGASLIAGTSTPAIDVSGVGTNLNLRAYSGGINITGMDNATSNATLEFTAGQAIIAASNTAGTIVIRGQVAPIVDNSAGATVITAAATRGFQLDELWKIRGLDASNPKTTTEVAAATDYDEDAAGIHVDQVKVGAVTTSTRV